jgi:protein-disulfide isomerase
MPFNNSPLPLRWYQRFGGGVGVGMIATILVLLISFGGLVWYYYSQIQSGNGQILFNNFYGGFTAADKKNEKIVDVDRSQVEVNTAPYIGTNNPKVTIVEFVDFKCPNCKAAAPILREVLQKYSSKVKLIIRHFPVESTHPGASQLAALSECAYQQGWFWPLHDWLYDNQDKIGSNISTADVDSLGSLFAWDKDKMRKCFVSNEAKITVNKDYADAYRFGVGGTPTFFINGKKVEGVIPFEVWDNFLRNVK